MSREPLQVVLAVVLVLVLAIGGPALLERAHRPAPRPAVLASAAIPRGQRRVTLEVAGMTCASCASKVSHRLQALAGVRACALDARTGRASVLCDNDVADTSLVRSVHAANRAFTATVVAH
jgi:copper chaperone CopZ